MAIGRDAIQRSSNQWIFQMQADMARKAQQSHHLRMANTIQTYQTEIGGTASRRMAWREMVLSFDEIIVDDAPINDFDHDEPHFAFGYTIRSGPPVIVSSFISAWLKDQDGNIYGCNVMVGAYDPNNSKKDFAGLLHLTFFGASIPDDDAPETDEDGTYDGKP